MHIRHFQEVCELIKEADTFGLLHQPGNLSGFSGNKVLGVLQRLAAYQSRLNRGCYLEIGVFQGLSLLSTASVLGDTPAFGVDNFSQFDKRGVNLRMVQDRIKATGIANATVINADYEDALEKLPEIVGANRIGTYFIDGPHDYRSQLMCLLLIRPYLSDSGIVVVDDCNYRHVRLANRDFLKSQPEFKLIFEAYTMCHPANMKSSEEERARLGWWNGINVIARDLDNVLQPLYPPTVRSRTIHENDHLVHSMKYASLAPEATALISALRGLDPRAAARALARVLANASRVDKKLVGRFQALNTFSDDLPEARYNSSCSLTP